MRVLGPLHLTEQHVGRLPASQYTRRHGGRSEGPYERNTLDDRWRVERADSLNREINMNHSEVGSDGSSCSQV